MYLSYSAAITLLSVLPSVLGHGYVQEVTLGSTKYPGWNPNTDPYYNPTPQRIVRKVPGNGPVEDLSLIDVQCNGYTAGGQAGSAPAATFGTVAAGATVSFNWTTWPSETHKARVRLSSRFLPPFGLSNGRTCVSPLITYMAKAPSDITKWSPGTSAVWFKVHQDGFSNGLWASDRLLTNKGIYSFTIPKTLQAGQYLIRHEILALHNAWAYPGAQVYPACAQVQVTGTGTATGPSSKVSFPGAYTASTPGIVFDVYKSFSSYPVPGPAVWSG
ncbi:glycoside hydrolase family 61 protein [Botryobasidium botryosum FD-172 SS1]|uniref:lytic cellulose monooxygenase (C4-dehydrogenating) n=1 Tax=Botryobasidium botryosum (strain FD-172 SS1) TaxID=930990 RepID=A0A067N321_BOTB1|nr:glycoside hydrolase family 61 protein [Botryobasidium botryosum FD-172 SS1]